MRIVELSEYTMTVMKDSEDPYWSSISGYYRTSLKHGLSICVAKGDYPDEPENGVTSSDSVCSGGMLVLFFRDKINSEFKVGDKVQIYFRKQYSDESIK